MSHLKGKLLLGFFQRETFADGSPGQNAMSALHIDAWCLCSPHFEHGWTKHSCLPSSKARGQRCLQTSLSSFRSQDVSHAIFSCSFRIAPKSQHYRITPRSCTNIDQYHGSPLQTPADPCGPLASASTSWAGQDPAGTTWSKASYLCSASKNTDDNLRFTCASSSFHHPMKCVLTSWSLWCI